MVSEPRKPMGLSIEAEGRVAREDQSGVVGPLGA